MVKATKATRYSLLLVFVLFSVLVTAQASSLLSEKKQQLTDVDKAISNTKALIQGANDFGETDMKSSYVSKQQSVLGELSELRSVLQYEVDFLSKQTSKQNGMVVNSVNDNQVIAEKKAKEEAEAKKQAELKQKQDTELKARGYLGELEVVAAAWGKTNVINKITSLIKEQGSFDATSALFGDGGISSYQKTLYVVLRSMSTGNHYYILLTEGTKFSLSNKVQVSVSNGTNKKGYKLVSAHYGPKDVTAHVQNAFLSNNPVKVTYRLYTDPWPGVYKTMTVVYVKDNIYHQSIGVESDEIRID